MTASPPGGPGTLAREPDHEADALREAARRLHRFGGAALVRDIHAIFVEDAPARLAAARHGVAEGNPRAVVRAAHSLKATCGQIGAATMQRLCADAERLAGDGAIDRVPPLLAALEEEFELVRAFLARGAAAPAEP